MSKIKGRNNKKERAIYIDDANFKKKIQPLLDRRVHLISQSVAGGFLGSNSPHTTNFRHILNRIMLLTQLPLSFIIFRKSVFQETYIEHYRSNKHPRDVAEIEKFLDLYRVGDPRILLDDYIPHLFPLFWDDAHPDRERYSLLVILIGKEKGKDRHTFHCLESKYSDDTMKCNLDLTAYVLREIFKHTLYSSYGDEFKKLLHKSIEKCTNEEIKPETPIVISRPVLEDVRDKFYKSLLRNKSFKFEIKNNGYLDRIYDKSHANLQQIAKFITTKEPEKELYEKAANYVIYVRDYADDLGEKYRRHPMKEWNFAGYNYRLRIALCDSQREDITKHFTEKVTYFKKKNEGLTESEPTRSYTKLTADLNNENIKKLASELDEYFWRELFSGKNEIDPYDFQEKSPLERFIKILGSPLSVNARSPVDSVFDGQIYFRQTFPDGGIPRCFPNGEVNCSSIAEVRKLSEDIFTDLLREVICHYWFEAMVNFNTVEELHETATMYLPVEVGGKIWCVFGYNTQIYKHKQDRIHISSQEASWYQNYHLFQDIVARKKKELRTSLFHAYVDLMAYYYEASLQDVAAIQMNDIPIKRGDDKHHQYNTWLNERFSALTSVFPYDRVEVKLENGVGGGGALSPNVSDISTKKPKTKRDTGKGSLHDGIYFSPTHRCVPTIQKNTYMPAVAMSKKEGQSSFVKIADVIDRLSEIAFSKFSECEIEKIQ